LKATKLSKLNYPTGGRYEFTEKGGLQRALGVGIRIREKGGKERTSYDGARYDGKLHTIATRVYKPLDPWNFIRGSHVAASRLLILILILFLIFLLLFAFGLLYARSLFLAISLAVVAGLRLRLLSGRLHFTFAVSSLVGRYFYPSQARKQIAYRCLNLPLPLFFPRVVPVRFSNRVKNRFLMLFPVEIARPRGQTGMLFLLR
jgi:hypothetical protein